MKKRTITITTVFFVAIHLAVLLAFLPPVWRATTSTSLLLALVLFLVRKFGLVGGYHRYFSHRSYKTGRVFQFILAWLGGSAAQKGVLWWASTHRHHHIHSDQAEDVHSPARDGFWWSHVGWVLSSDHTETNEDLIRDFAKYPELRWLNQYELLPYFALFPLCYWVDGWAGVVWGMIISTVVLYHTTFAINSFCHIFGRRRFPTTDDSHNSMILSLLTLGEGWHNNHHFYQASANSGFYWWEIDVTYYVIKLLSFLGITWDLKKPPRRVLEMGKHKNLTAEMVESLRAVHRQAIAATPTDA